MTPFWIIESKSYWSKARPAGKGRRRLLPTDLDTGLTVRRRHREPSRWRPAVTAINRKHLLVPQG
jgi:hypothetical protein